MSDPFSWLSPTQTSPSKDRFPALEFVPCPGEPQTSKHVANIVQRTAKALDEISDALHGTDDADWKGRHADAFREQFDDDFRPKVDKAKRSFGKAARALTTWADEMPVWQRKAEALEKQAQDAKDALRAAKGKLSGLPPQTPARPAAQGRRRSARAGEDREGPLCGAAGSQHGGIRPRPHPCRGAQAGHRLRPGRPIRRAPARQGDEHCAERARPAGQDR